MALAWIELDLGGDPFEPQVLGDPGDIVDALGDLLAAAERPAWHRHAACRGKGADVFYVERGQSTDPAKQLCASCPVVEECLEASRGERHGVWGGLSERQRRRLRRVSPIGDTEAA